MILFTFVSTSNVALLRCCIVALFMGGGKGVGEGFRVICARIWRDLKREGGFKGGFGEI